MFLFGGLAYGAIEVTFRGFTHWSMLITGGICLCGIYLIETHLHLPLWVKAGLGCILITSAEFAVGVLVNRILHWNVWDYSGMRMNVMGQICPLFSFFWYLLSIPALYLCRWLHTALPLWLPGG
ncbi:MAG: hypothetical protein ACI3XR_04310 [Eubacteriales bacterium]